jgi:PAS domain S-box-containing protein
MVSSLKAEKEFTEAALDAMTGIFSIREPRGRFVRRNRTLAELAPADRDARELVVPEDRALLEAKLEEVLERGHSEAELRFDLGGEVRHFLVNARRAEIGGKVFVVSSGVDITDLRRAESERTRLQESLRRSERMSAMGALVAGVAHEVRNPLFGISATLDSHEAELRTRPELTEMAATLKEQVRRLSNLMQELLDYGKPARLRMGLDALEPVVREAVASCADLARSARVGVEVNVPRVLPSLLIDERRLAQVFRNLIDNAIRHSPPEGRVRVSAAEMEEGGMKWVECRVEDEGRGFGEADAAAVFEPFFSRREGGTGLGLSIVQRVVDEHSGLVWAGNRVEGGGVVTVRLPVVCEGARRPS